MFTGAFEGKKPGEYLYLTMSEDPLGPGGGYVLCRDKPPCGDLEQEIPFHQFPRGCQALILEKYRELWDLG